MGGDQNCSSAIDTCSLKDLAIGGITDHIADPLVLTLSEALNDGAGESRCSEGLSGRTTYPSTADHHHVMYLRGLRRVGLIVGIELWLGAR